MKRCIPSRGRADFIPVGIGRGRGARAAHRFERCIFTEHYPTTGTRACAVALCIGVAGGDLSIDGGGLLFSINIDAAAHPVAAGRAVLGDGGACMVARYIHATGADGR